MYADRGWDGRGKVVRGRQSRPAGNPDQTARETRQGKERGLEREYVVALGGAGDLH